MHFGSSPIFMLVSLLLLDLQPLSSRRPSACLSLDLFQSKRPQNDAQAGPLGRLPRLVVLRQLLKIPISIGNQVLHSLARILMHRELLLQATNASLFWTLIRIAFLPVVRSLVNLIRQPREALDRQTPEDRVNLPLMSRPMSTARTKLRPACTRSTEL